VTITLPDAGKRFRSMQVISQDHYAPMVVYTPGGHQVTRAKVGTRYAVVGIRTLVDPGDPQDVQRASAWPPWSLGGAALTGSGPGRAGGGPDRSDRSQASGPRQGARAGHAMLPA
jgi:hypothetical protein